MVCTNLIGKFGNVDEMMERIEYVVVGNIVKNW